MLGKDSKNPSSSRRAIVSVPRKSKSTVFHHADDWFRYTWSVTKHIDQALARFTYYVPLPETQQKWWQLLTLPLVLTIPISMDLQRGVVLLEGNEKSSVRSSIWVKYKRDLQSM